MLFTEKIMNWYEKNKRDLPWRNTDNPYFIWISEIILQQTRIAQGEAYYYRFIKQFPTIQYLANASEQEVLKLWQGLGYYSRARNLHFTAKYICHHFKGIFPSQYDEIRNLKGIGDYTAAAIISFAFKQSFPAIDGNGFRVLSRIFGIETPINASSGKKAFYQLASELIDKKRPDLFNQALIEFGALYCTPKNADCLNCIFRIECFARINNKINNLPVKTKQLKSRERYFYYFFINTNKGFYIEKRIKNDIWKNLFQLPLIETDSALETEQLMQSEDWKNIFHDSQLFMKEISSTYIHQLSHQKIIAKFFHIETKCKKMLHAETYFMIKQNEMYKYPFPKLIVNYFEQKNIS